MKCCQYFLGSATHTSSANPYLQQAKEAGYRFQTQHNGGRGVMGARVASTYQNALHFSHRSALKKCVRNCSDGIWVGQYFDV